MKGIEFQIDARFAPASRHRHGVDSKDQDKMGPRSRLVPLAAPQAVKYYLKVGFTKHQSAWMLRAEEPLTARH